MRLALFGVFTHRVQTESGPGDFKSSLASVQSIIDNGETCTMVIHWSRILKSTLVAVNRPSFSYQCHIVVEFAGEDAQDNGGPRREYLRY